MCFGNLITIVLRQRYVLKGFQRCNVFIFLPRDNFPKALVTKSRVLAPAPDKNRLPYWACLPQSVFLTHTSPHCPALRIRGFHGFSWDGNPCSCVWKRQKNPEVQGSRSYQSSVSPLFRIRAGRVDFRTGTGRKAFFDFFRPDSEPPPVHMFLQRKKGKFIGTGHFFPHCFSFLEKKRGGLVLVYVFFSLATALKTFVHCVSVQSERGR